MLLRFGAILVLALVLGPLIVGAWPVLAEMFTLEYWVDHGNAQETMSAVFRNDVLLFVAISALPLAIWRAVTADKQAHIAERGHFTDRYSSAVDNMASEHMAIRVGGTYALFQLAEEAEGADYISVMDMLCAFVRSPPEITDASESTFREDVQEILHRLFTRGDANLRRAEYNINLNEGILIGANLYKADLRGAYPYGANLSWADLTGTNLNGVDLTGANLNGADFHNARGAPDLSESCADPDYPPINLPDDAKLPKVWEPCPSE